VSEIEQTIRKREDYLILANGNLLFFHIVDLHGLSAAGGWCDTAEKESYRRNDMLPSYRTMKYKSPIWGYFHVQKE
jgi:hypothetical protein